MNAAQRRVLVRALFVLGAVCATWVLLVLVAWAIGDGIPRWAAGSLGQATLGGIVGLVLGLYLRVGGKSE